jgi:hypothetical protein
MADGRPASSWTFDPKAFGVDDEIVAARVSRAMSGPISAPAQRSCCGPGYRRASESFRLLSASC